jgi:hypothetical protein
MILDHVRIAGELLQTPKLLRLRAFRGGSLQIRDSVYPEKGMMLRLRRERPLTQRL